MTQRAPRVNAYAEPIAPLTDARQERMDQRPANRQAIEALLALLRERWPQVLCRGWYGTLVIDIEVRDGMIGQDVQLTERRSCRIRE